MEAVAEKATRERPAEDTPSTAVTEALKGLSDVMLSVSVPARVSRLAAVFVLALLIGDALRPGSSGAPWPEAAWVAIYIVFAAYLIRASTYVAKRLVDLGPRIDGLLDSHARSEATAEWIRRTTPGLPQVVGCGVLAGGVAAAVGLVVGGSTSSPPVRLGWLLGVFLAMFFAFDAVSWVVRFVLLVARVSREKKLAMHDPAPVQTPAVRELRDFSATLAAITGVGLFFFSAPLLWLIIYVQGHGVDVAPLRTWSLVAFGMCASIALYAAIAPQVYLALLVGSQRDRILDEIDLTIPKDDHTRLLDPDVVQQRALFDSIAATRTSTIGVTSVMKWALGIVAPALPFVVSWIESSIGL
jgi:hypothetical protein